MRNIAESFCSASTKSEVIPNPHITPREAFADPDARRFSAASGSAESLPCLYSNNDTEIDQNTVNKFSPYHRKQAETLFQNTQSFVNEVGLENVGFLTLTFADNVTDHKEAYRRFKSLTAHFLGEHFGNWLLVKERQKRGAWHYHLLVDCRGDIRTGVDFSALARMDYATCNKRLRGLWSVLRKDLRKYGFGRSELLPIRSNAEGVARYVGKYISKHVGARSAQDKGVRLFSASRGFRASNTHFSWNTVGSWVWRVKVREFAAGNGIGSYPGLQARFGDKWAFKHAALIYDQEIPKNTVFPTVQHWQAAYGFDADFVPLGYVEGMTTFRVIDHMAIPVKYDKDWEYSSYENVPRRVLAEKYNLPTSQSDMPFEEPMPVASQDSGKGSFAPPYVDSLRLPW